MPVPTGVVKLKTRVLSLLTFQKVVPYIGGGIKKIREKDIDHKYPFFPLFETKQNNREGPYSLLF